MAKTVTPTMKTITAMMKVKVITLTKHKAGYLHLLVTAILLSGCASPSSAPSAAKLGQRWSVTAWGSSYEVYPEAGPLIAGQPTVAYTHVTSLDGFAPLHEGSVEIIFAGPSGRQVFRADETTSNGLFEVEITPEATGEFEVTYRILGSAGDEEIRGGKVRVGTAQQPGGLIVAPAPRGASSGGAPQSFLKEEQWQSKFATSWVRSGKLPRSVSGLARLRPPAGGEAVVAAPVDGLLRPVPGDHSWPFVGLDVRRGKVLFSLEPRVAASQSLAVLEAARATLASELTAARARLARLDELLQLEATSQREVEEARSRVESLEARHSAADRDFTAARSSRQSAAAGKHLHLRAPFSGRVARIDVSPGATVNAGEALARVVRTDAIWIELAASPNGARQIAEQGVRGVVLEDPEQGAIRLEEGVRLVSVAPEVSPTNGTVTVLLAAPATPGLVLGTTVDARVLSAEESQGIIIPSSAVIDDGGVDVVYLQLTGESFVRQEIEVLERQGGLLRVAGLIPGQRLVSRGGNGIRRSSLMASGGAHGHVH